MTKSTGTCFCGAITVEVEGDPVTQGFCHCDDCRAWSGAPITAYALWPAPAVRVTAGEDLLAAYSRTGATIRKHCKECGSLILADQPETGLTDVFPLRLAGLDFAPAGHVFYAQRVVDMPDGLPKFSDLPAEAGGSGAMIDD